MTNFKDYKNYEELVSKIVEKLNNFSTNFTKTLKRIIEIIKNFKNA